MHFTITSEYSKIRLDKFLKEHFSDLSRAYLQKLIAAGNVRVNGAQVSAHHFLKAGDEVEAVVEPVEELRVMPNPEVRIVVHNAPQPPLNLRGGAGGVTEILHEEPDFLVLNKPAGLVVHQGEGHKAPDTLVNGLLARYKDSPSAQGLSFSRVGEDPVRPGIVHRLDGDVSGVMVVARTQDMFDHLKRQFKLHEVEKEYVAVVEGQVLPPEGVIEFAVARKAGKMVARPKGAEGKRAITEYEVIRLISPIGLIGPISLLRIRTRTGRAHQIRVHLKAIGHPILGDTLYRSKSSKVSKLSEVSRLMLHARRVAFKDLTGTRHEFICEPPEEFLS